MTENMANTMTYSETSYKLFQRKEARHAMRVCTRTFHRILLEGTIICASLSVWFSCCALLLWAIKVCVSAF